MKPISKNLTFLLVLGSVCLIVLFSTQNVLSTIQSELQKSCNSNSAIEVIGPYDHIPSARKSVELQSEFCRLSSTLSQVFSNSEKYVVHKETRLHGVPFNIAVYRKNDIVSDNILKNGGWDTDKISMFNRALKALETKHGRKFSFVDIGANIGYLTHGVASHGHKTYAFEPMQDNEIIIRTSACMNPALDITYFNVGLGEKEKTCVLFSGKDNIGDGTLSCAENFQVPAGYEVRSQLKVETLDKFDSVLENIGAIKIDVEGFEANVILGGKTVFAKAAYVIMEFQPGWIKNNGQDPKQLLQWFHEQGFQMNTDKFAEPFMSVEETFKKCSNGFYDIYMVKKGNPLVQ